MKTLNHTIPRGVALKLFTLAVATTAGLGLTQTHAAVNVAATGSDVQTFDTAPVSSSWSTRSWAGAPADVTDTTALDAAVQLLAATDIVTTIPANAANPPAANANARQNTTLKVLQTRPTTAVKGCLLKATLQNTTGDTTNLLEISYDFGKPVTAVEEVPGLRVYYSLTGAAGSWTVIPALSTDVAGALSTVVTLSSPWADATPMYLLWVDDSSAAVGDAYTLDNVKFSVAADLKSFGLPGTLAGMKGTTVHWYVPPATDVTTLAPTYTLSAGAACLPASGSTQDFTSPVHYVVTSSDTLNTNDYTVTVIVGPVPVGISGTQTQNLDTVVGTGPALLLANAQTHFDTTTSVADVILGDYQFTLDNGNGNGQYYNGAITGPGTLRVNGSPAANWDPDIQLGGTVSNSPDGVILVEGRVKLNKTAGVDALAGPITVATTGSNTVRIQLLASNQINDASTITTTGGSATSLFYLDMGGFNETFSSLDIRSGHKVDTGIGGILNVTTLTVGGVVQPKGAYTASSGFVLGTGYIDVDNFGPPVILLPPGVPSSPTPADSDSTVHPAYLAKLTWAVATDATSYDVYLWLASETKPVTPTANVALPEYPVSPQVLSLENYKWQVVAKNGVGDTPGPEWTFSTVDRRNISGNLTQTLDAIVGAGPAELTANAMTTWPPITSVVDINLNTFQFTINNGNGNGQTYNGAIAGPGTLVLQGSGGANWDPDIQLGGTLANSPTAVTINSGAIRLNKTAGVDALAGPITVTVSGSNTVRLKLLASNQISDASTLDSSSSSGAFYLELGGFSETFSGLSINTGHQVDTGSGGVLTVSSLTVGGVLKDPGTYTSADAFVAGTGSVVVAGVGNSYGTWAAANAGGQAADLDFDNDGMSNGIEYFMGATGSSFTPNPPVVNTAGVLTVTWPRDPDAVASFMVQVSDDLTVWTDIVPPDASINETVPTEVTYTMPTGAAKKFCRLVVTP